MKRHSLLSLKSLTLSVLLTLDQSLRNAAVTFETVIVIVDTTGHFLTLSVNLNAILTAEGDKPVNLKGVVGASYKRVRCGVVNTVFPESRTQTIAEFLLLCGGLSAKIVNLSLMI